METDTICAIATAATSAGISIIRISGNQAIKITDSIFVPQRKGKSVSSMKTYTMCYGHIVDNGDVIDEVIVSLMRGPKSYTAEDVVEINCHGGFFVTETILKLCVKHGCRIAEPGEFTKRAFLNGRIDLSQAEAVIDVINASNNDSLRNSAGQLSGRLSNEIRTLRESILRDVAFIEAALDDPEHIEIDGFAEKLDSNTDRYLEKIDKLIYSYKNGKIIQNGIKTVILGKPNAGKSTLLNTLSGTDRAIVTDIPGTTRDTLEELISIDGISLRVIDTAGIRDTVDIVEKIGVEKALEAVEDADLILFVADASRELDDNDLKILDFIKEKTFIPLLNKSDLSAVISAEKLSEISHKAVISISAKDEKGLDVLILKIKELFGLGLLEKSEDIMITSERHLSLLEKAGNSLKLVKNSILNNMSEDFFSIDLMDCYASLGDIIGEKISDDLADKIFSEFCMGK